MTVSQDRRGRHAVPPGLAKNLHRQFRLGRKLYFLRNPYGRTAFPVLGPTLRQIQPPDHRDGHPSVTDHDFHTDLAVGPFADRSAVLRQHSDQVRALLHPPRLVYHSGLRRFQGRNNLPSDRLPLRFLAPRTVGDELLQALRVHAQPFRHRPDRLPPTGISSPSTYRAAAPRLSLRPKPEIRGRINSGNCSSYASRRVGVAAHGWKPLVLARFRPTPRHGRPSSPQGEMAP